MSTLNKTEIRVPGEIRTRHLSKQAPEDPCHRPRDHRDRHQL